MVKANRPFISLLASGRWAKVIRVVKRAGRQVVYVSPDPPDSKSLAQLSWRHMYQKAVALWHALSAAEKLTWESAGTARHMTGFAWFMSQCLKPNPGLYLPLQGGTMTGEIVMSGNELTGLTDPTDPQDADTQAARDAAIAAALADCIDSHIHGWDGADWQKLRVEAAAVPNLRVRLYAGANPIQVVSAAASIGAAAGALTVNACLRAFGGTDMDYVEGRTSNADGVAVSLRRLLTSSGLYGYNGATWDRLRSYGTGILKVGRAEVGLSTPRLVGTGQVKASPGNLYWMLLNPSAGLSLFELSNDLDGSTAVVLDHFDTSRDGHMLTFDPPMQFTTGIYLKTFTNMTSIIFGYL